LDGGGRAGKAAFLGTYRSNQSLIINDTLNKRESSEWYRFSLRRGRAHEAYLSTTASSYNSGFTTTQVKAEILQKQGSQFSVVSRAFSGTTSNKNASLKPGEYYLKISRVPQTQEVLGTGFYLFFY
jgi:hypothetical protein